MKMPAESKMLQEQVSQSGMCTGLSSRKVTQLQDKSRFQQHTVSDSLHSQTSYDNRVPGTVKSSNIDLIVVLPA